MKVTFLDRRPDGPAILALPTYDGMTNKDMADAISDGLHEAGYYINPDDLPEIWEVWERYIEDLMLTPDEIFKSSDYAYFSII